MAAHSSILPGKPHGQRSLVGRSPLGCEESDTTYRPNSNNRRQTSGKRMGATLGEVCHLLFYQKVKEQKQYLSSEEKNREKETQIWGLPSWLQRHSSLISLLFL